MVLVKAHSKYLSKVGANSLRAANTGGEHQACSYTAEVEYVAKVLASALPEAKSLLDFGCGTGRHGRLLASRGFNVLGVEKSESMLIKAKRASGAI